MEKGAQSSGVAEWGSIGTKFVLGNPHKINNTKGWELLWGACNPGGPWWLQEEGPRELIVSQDCL